MLPSTCTGILDATRRLLSCSHRRFLLPALHGLSFFLMAMCDQPVLRQAMKLAEGGATCNHHPHCKSWICRRSRLPLTFGYEKILYLLHILRPQNHVQTLTETCIFCHI